MTTRWLLFLGTLAAVACVSIGTGAGVAAAETDGASAGGSTSTGKSAGGKSTHGQSTKAAVAGSDSSGGGSTTGAAKIGSTKPESTVSASTVTVRNGSQATSGEATTSATTSTGSNAPQRSSSTATTSTKRDTITGSLAKSPSAATSTPATDASVTAATDSTEKAKPAPATEVAQNIAAIRSLAAPVANAPPAPGPVATLVLGLLSGLGLQPPTAAADTAGFKPPPAAEGTSAAAQAPSGSPSANGVTGVQMGSSDLYIPVGSSSYTARADWYFPTQADGTVDAQGVIYLQHGFLGFKSWYGALAMQQAQQTNSIVVVPNIPWFQFPWNCSGCLLSGAPMAEGVAGLFTDPERTWLTASANAAGYGRDTLPEDFVLTGHSAGGGLAVTAGGDYTEAIFGESHLKGVVMYDGVTATTNLDDSLNKLGDIPVYQIAAPPQPWNADGQTTADLVELRPDQFVGDVLVNGSHVDSLIGGVPIIDVVSQLVIRRSPPGNTDAVYTLSNGWINDFYAGGGPTDPLYGFYGSAGQPIIMGEAGAVVLGTPQAGQTPSPVPTPANTNGVTGVTVGHSDLEIPVGSEIYSGAADWYFPTQADGTVAAQGVSYLQHGFLGSNAGYSRVGHAAGAADQQHRGRPQHPVLPDPHV